MIESDRWVAGMFFLCVGLVVDYVLFGRSRENHIYIILHKYTYLKCASPSSLCEHLRLRPRLAEHCLQSG